MNKDFCVLIPARSGSKSVLDKNIQYIESKNLIEFSVIAAKKSGVSNIFVSTNSLEYKEIAEKSGAQVPFLRPENISQDKSTDNEYLSHFAKELSKINNSIKYIILFRPTTPLRKINTIKRAIKIFQKNIDHIDSLRSAHAAPESPYKWFLKDNSNLFKGLEPALTPNDVNLPRQDFDQVFIPNGYIDVLKIENIYNNNFFNTKMYVYETEVISEIDSKEELDYIRFQFKNFEDRSDYVD